MVAQLFCEGYKEDLQVNHINGNSLDNRSENLEWVTAKENIRDTFIRGTGDTHTARKELQKVSKKKVKQINLVTGEVIKIHNSVTEAAKEVGVQQSKISTVASGYRKSTGGFGWEYLNDSDRSKPIEIIVKTSEGEVLEFPSLRSSSRELGVSLDKLYYHLRTKGKKQYETDGYIWEVK